MERNTGRRQIACRLQNATTVRQDIVRLAGGRCGRGKPGMSDDGSQQRSRKPARGPGAAAGGGSRRRCGKPAQKRFWHDLGRAPTVRRPRSKACALCPKRPVPGHRMRRVARAVCRDATTSAACSPTMARRWRCRRQVEPAAPAATPALQRRSRGRASSGALTYITRCSAGSATRKSPPTVGTRRCGDDAAVAYLQAEGTLSRAGE